MVEVNYVRILAKSSGARVDKEGLEGTSDMRHLNGFLGFGMISCAKKGGCS